MGSPRTPHFLSWPTLQMPMMLSAHAASPRFSAEGVSHQSSIVGPQTHRLPFQVMWGITFFTAVGMAVLNFGMILLIQFLVRFKFMLMKSAILQSGIDQGILVLVGISLGYSLLGVCLIQFLAPQCGGSGIPENKTYLNGGSMPGLFSVRTLYVRIVTNILANAAGFPVGREGPLVSIGSNLAFLLCKYIACPFVREWVDVSGPGSARALLVDEQRLAHATRISCTVGGACAIAVIFNAPFGGLLYMFEEVTSVAWPLELTFRVFVATMFCSLLSYGLCYLVGEDITEFVIYVQAPQDKKWAWADIPIFVCLSVLLGIMTSFHTRALLWIATWRQAVRHKLRAYQPSAVIIETACYAAMCALAASLTSLLATCAEQGESGLEYVTYNCPSGQYNPVASLLVATSHSSVKILFSGNNDGEIQIVSSLLAFLTYSMMNVGMSGLPVPGGAVTATMLMGAMVGRAVGALSKQIGLTVTKSGVYAIVGSAAMLCGFKQMTLASVIIVVECVNDLSLAPIVMLGVAVSMSINWSINARGHDAEAIVRKELPFLEGEAPQSLDSVLALNLCDPVPAKAILRSEASIEEIQNALEDNQIFYFPIRDQDHGPCMGIVMRPHLEALLTAVQHREGLVAISEHDIFLDTEICESLNTMVSSLLRPDAHERLPLHRVMDPTPFVILEDMPATRLYALFAKAGERAACVTSIRGELRGIISREGLIAATRHR